MRLVKRSVVVLLAVALLLLMAPAGLGDTFRVKAKGDSPSNFRWDPDFRHITKGNKILWKNTTDFTHRVVAYSDNWSYSKEIGAGEKTRKRFKKTGTFDYRCTITGHSTLSGEECEGMCGTIHVTKN
jgi:plastocyanin